MPIDKKKSYSSEKLMKIVYLHQYFNTPNMSGGTRSYEIARYLVGAGHEVHIVTTDRNLSKEKNKEWYKTNEAGIHVHWLPIPYSNEFSYRNRIKAFFKFAIKAAFKAASLGGDVVFATSTPLTIESAGRPDFPSDELLVVPMSTIPVAISTMATTKESVIGSPSKRTPHSAAIRMLLDKTGTARFAPMSLMPE